MAYDADAMEALDQGLVPSCHAVVGVDAIFHNDCPDDATRCRGHDLWLEGVAGFNKPATL